MRASGDRRRRLARRGEALAALMLRLKGYRIEARNWRCALGEIDIVAWRRGVVVFVEVKTRGGRGAGSAAEAVDERKRRQLIRLAGVYLGKYRGDPPPSRFDVVTVETEGVVPRVRHLRAAFRADGLV